MNYKKLVQTTLLGLALSTSTFAQTGGSVGGGRFSELQLKGFMDKLVAYFSNAESLALFPEVRDFNQTSKSGFIQLLKSIEPKVVSHPVYSHGEERDCVSMIDGNRRYFECNEAKLPEATLENQPLLYALLAHESFVHAGLEQPSNTVVSEYPLAKRFLDTRNLSLVSYTVEEWVPGVVKAKQGIDPNLLFECEDTVNNPSKIYGYLKDPDMNDRPTLEISYTGPSGQRIVIQSIKHEDASKPYVILGDISKESACISWGVLTSERLGSHLRAAQFEECDTEDYVTHGKLKLTINSSTSGHYARPGTEEDYDTTIGSLKYLSLRTAFKSESMLVCKTNFQALQKLIKLKTK